MRVFALACILLRLAVARPMRRSITTNPELILGEMPNSEQKLELHTGTIPPSSCKELLGGGTNESGLYTLNLGDNEGEFEVYCDMNPGLFGGGWTTIMRRGPNEPLDLFYKDWKAYQTGFGTFHGSFWMGLEKIHRITTSDNYELYLGFEDVLGFTAWARYSTFSIGDENSKYLLTVGGYEGTAGDSLRDHNDHMFSTKDQDNDTINETHCAQVFHGGWWFENMACHDSNLNGRYYENGITPTGKDDGISWHSWRGPDMSITKVVMALRPTA